jgi:hypothetical protein
VEKHDEVEEEVEKEEKAENSSEKTDFFIPRHWNDIT